MNAKDVATMVNLARELAAIRARVAELETEQNRRREAVSWSFIRTLLSQGMSIQQDYDAGKYKNYEEVAARLDEAARERIAALELKWIKT